MTNTSPHHTRAHIRAIASALPSEEVPSAYWDRAFGLPDGTIAARTGIERRYRCGPGESAQTLAAKAVNRALEEASIQPRDIGIVLDCSAGTWQPLPSNAACLLETLGPAWTGIPGIDIRNTCLGFVAGLDLAQRLVDRHRHVLVVSSETPFPALRMDDPHSAPLFGEGAAAAVVSASPHARPYYYAVELYASHRAACEIAGGGLRLPPERHGPHNAHLYQFAMDGARVHRAASTHLPGMVQRFRSALGERCEATWIPHPASGPAVELLRRRLRIPAASFFCSIAEHGNLISAGIPHQLSLARQRLPSLGDIVLIGTAAGYSQAILAWNNHNAA